MVYYIAQAFGIFGLIVMIISLFQKNKDKMLLYVIFNGMFFAVEYCLLGAISGMLSNIFGIGRTIAFRQKEKNKKFDKIYVLLFFIIGYIVIGIISFDGSYISLLPIIAEIIYILSLWQKSVTRIRAGTLVMVIIWLIYDIIVQAYPSAITDAIVMTSTIVAIIVNDILPRFKGGKMKGTKKITTKRLTLRKIKLNDYKAIYNSWTSDKNVSKYVTWDAHKNEDETKQLTEYWVNEYNNEYTYRWLVVNNETKEIMGMIDVIHKDLQYMTCELGYCYGSKYWGNGYATEALKAVIEYLHKEGFPVVYAQYFESNKASGKVMEKAGMKYEAKLKSRVVTKDGKREDLVVYSSIAK